MPKPTIHIAPIGQKLITGQTSSRIDSQADATQYRVTGSFHVDYSLLLQYQQWQTGETDIVCVEAKGSNLLNTVIGRMRLSVYRYKNNEQWLVLKTAQLKSQSPPHANLFMAGADYYQEQLGFSLVEFLNLQAPCMVGTKEDLLNETGRSKNALTVIHNKKDINIPLAAFTASRVFTLLMNT
ncbi:hypothetical protein [Jiulongibacter sediminis]|uniref:hypothetical protein n=1 Tax=Jiulongibacter sediminis TaxID=1605367 RepID=UPI0026F044EC|nr:hypothetical protein [Jiulongibacter sediminis]